MSKIGKLPIPVREGVSVTIDGQNISVTGPKGTLRFSLPEGISVSLANGTITVAMKADDPDATSALFGLTRAIIANMVKGVCEGFSKKLELSGVGYRAATSGQTLTLSLGFSHPVVVEAPEGIEFSVSENTITVSGIDKALVGEIAAKVRAIRPPEPYKGKGISYLGERIRRKAGKAAKAVGTK